jgi:hypothetical protein
LRAQKKQTKKLSKTMLFLYPIKGIQSEAEKTGVETWKKPFE